jgi:hypothetical protein
LGIVWKGDSSAARGADSERPEGKVDFRPAISGECAKEQKQFPRRAWNEQAEHRADLPLLAKCRTRKCVKKRSMKKSGGKPPHSKVHSE